MARTMHPTFIPTATASGGTAYLALENIPQEIQDEVEATYAGLKENPNGRMRVAFDTAEELAEFVNQVISYCAQRPAGAIRFRKSPTRGLPATMMDYRISDLKEPVPVEVPAVTVPPVTVPAKATASRRR